MFLFGLGVGLVVSSFAFALEPAPKLEEQEIISKAKKLDMVFEEEVAVFSGTAEVSKNNDSKTKKITDESLDVKQDEEIIDKDEEIINKDREMMRSQ